jgi:hypothetical protein
MNISGHAAAFIPCHLVHRVLWHLISRPPFNVAVNPGVCCQLFDA